MGKMEAKIGSRANTETFFFQGSKNYVFRQFILGLLILIRTHLLWKKSVRQKIVSSVPEHRNAKNFLA